MYGRAYTWTIFGVSNKQASHKQENKHVLIARLCYIKTKTKRQCIVYCLLRSAKLLFSNALKHFNTA